MRQVIKAAFLVLALALCSCARHSIDIDSEFSPYLEAIQAEVNSRHGSPYFTTMTSVIFVPDFGGMPWDAYCNWSTDSWGHTKRVIRVNRAEWDALPYSQRLMILAHELGHCVLHREHVTGKIDFTRQDGKSVKVFKSVMYPKAAQVGTLLDTFATQDQDTILNYYFDELLK